MRKLDLARVAVGTTKLHFIRVIGIIRWRSARTPTAKLETAVWAAMRSPEGRGTLAIAKKVTLKQNLMVLGGLRNQIRIMPDYPLRRFLPDFGPQPLELGAFFWRLQISRCRAARHPIHSRTRIRRRRPRRRWRTSALVGVTDSTRVSFSPRDRPF
jgi:hypothetical protein